MTNPTPDAVPGHRYRPGPDGHGLDIDTAYTRCPRCGLVATSTGVSYAIAADGDLDTRSPLELSCQACGHHYTVGLEHLLAHDATCRCVRCQTTFTVPAVADQVVCPGCRLYQDAPLLAADDGRRAHLDSTRRQRLAQIHAHLRPGEPGTPDGSR